MFFFPQNFPHLLNDPSIFEGKLKSLYYDFIFTVDDVLPNEIHVL